MTILASMLSACATIDTPMHTPQGARFFNIYYNVPADRISKISIYPNGIQQYSIKLDNGPLTGAINLETNSDTLGLELLTKGNAAYTVKVVRYQIPGRQGYAHLVGAIEPAKTQDEIDSDIALRKAQDPDEIAKRKAEERNAEEQRVLNLKRDNKRKELGACYTVVHDGYYCFDDISKLKNHDTKSASRLLINATRIIMKQHHRFRSEDFPTQIGQWYIETANDNLIHVTILQDGRLMGETTLVKEKRAGSFYYFERDTKTFADQ